jgi:hypothetical protein
MGTEALPEIPTHGSRLLKNFSTTSGSSALLQKCFRIESGAQLISPGAARISRVKIKAQCLPT